MHIVSFILLFVSSLFASRNAETTINLVCPPDVWLNCGAEIWDLSPYGTAYYYINGTAYQAGQAQVVYDLTTCETGKIYRTWQVEDYDWNIITCTQTIYISGGNFNYHNIEWPKTDLQLYGCNTSTHPDNLPQEYRRPKFDYMSCSMVGSSYKDQVFIFGPDCKKILRKWTVLDWCNYYPGNSNPGVWTYTQIIKVSNQEEPVLTCPAKVDIVATECTGAYLNLLDVLVDKDGCTGVYQIFNDSPFADADRENASGFYPIGETIINYSVEYACGQRASCSQDIQIKDKAPVPYCLSTLNVALMPVDEDGDGTPEDGMVELWAKDLDYGSYHPCYPAENLKFSFSSNVDSSFFIFNCNHVGLNEMQLWVTDSRENQSWCSVTVNVQNNAANIPDCRPPDQNLTGVVENKFAEPLENVYIDIKSRAYYKTDLILDTIMEQVVIDSIITNGGLMVYIYDTREKEITRPITRLVHGEVHNILTDKDGKFFTPELDPSRKYTITAFRFGDNNKIDQEDINLLKNHIDSGTKFINPFTYLAADINEDKVIDETDLAILQDIYTGEEDEWPRERQWVFYNTLSLESVSEETHPLQIELSENIVLDQGVDRFDDKKFTGILKGDLGRYEGLTDKQITEPRANADNRTSEIRPYPNPFIEKLYFDNPEGINWNVEVFTSDGRYVLNKSSDDKVIELNLDEASRAQMYIYRISSGQNQYMGKVLRKNL